MSHHPPGDASPSSGSLGIVGSGPSAIFLLRHLLDAPPSSRPARITIFEKSAVAGTGMPYSESTTDRHHLSNISSAEIPPLMESLATWLCGAEDEQLEWWGIRREEISESAIYPRLALGAYFRSQYLLILRRLHECGVEVEERVNTSVTDVKSHPRGHVAVVTLESGEHFSFHSLVIATGHQWPSRDRTEDGYFTSPWPIAKILPAEGEYYTFDVGVLGASLSAFDVVTTLAHHHGAFHHDDDGKLTYTLHPEAEGFRLILHSADGQLPHLLFEQTEPMRKIYRHTTRERLAELVDAAGFISLASYFDEVCRPVLIEGFTLDGRADIASRLESEDFTLADLVETLSAEHDYDDPFEGMAGELAIAEKLTREGTPTHWKEYLDDLFYTLNFHAELLPAEDHARLKADILPFVMSVVAAMPADSARKLLALRAAGIVHVVAGMAEVHDHEPGDGCTRVEVDGEDGKTRTEEFRIFIESSGQKPSAPGKHPFPSIFGEGIATPATVRFRDPRRAGEMDDEAKVTDTASGPALELGGLAYDREYRLVNESGTADRVIHDIALPDINGLRPYSYGLQAANEAAAICAAALTGQPTLYGLCPLAHR
ncbi:FAD/NAD(P)-binding protein [Luteolibacter flavescens]|uniref:FAD/NAD(P)-binding protein n=1 Tax=Luteolibacter flavescens TaxID=1859460 RepID=A0ABT3FQ70_9BACT|nr:FAD/NAD(P)-binding protein [Luteolibacter flavescens]MCW1885464.1 FAD/NAD(P)-binding protein [Luteolibacter flavescens]